MGSLIRHRFIAILKVAITYSMIINVNAAVHKGYYESAGEEEWFVAMRGYQAGPETTKMVRELFDDTLRDAGNRHSRGVMGCSPIQKDSKVRSGWVLKYKETRLLCASLCWDEQCRSTSELVKEDNASVRILLKCTLRYVGNVKECYSSGIVGDELVRAAVAAAAGTILVFLEDDLWHSRSIGSRIVRSSGGGICYRTDPEVGTTGNMVYSIDECSAIIDIGSNAVTIILLSEANASVPSVKGGFVRYEGAAVYREVFGGLRAICPDTEKSILELVAKYRTGRVSGKRNCCPFTYDPEYLETAAACEKAPSACAVLMETDALPTTIMGCTQEAKLSIVAPKHCVDSCGEIPVRRYHLAPFGTEVGEDVNSKVYGKYARYRAESAVYKVDANDKLCMNGLNSLLEGTMTESSTFNFFTEEWENRETQLLQSLVSLLNSVISSASTWQSSVALALVMVVRKLFKLWRWKLSEGYEDNWLLLLVYNIPFVVAPTGFAIYTLWVVANSVVGKKKSNKFLVWDGVQACRPELPTAALVRNARIRLTLVAYREYDLSLWVMVSCSLAASAVPLLVLWYRARERI
jgi:hypothetical protein